MRLAGIGLVALLAAALAVGPLLHGQSPTDQDLMAVLQPPSASHPAGTDQYGRDVLARLLAGGRTSLLAAGTIMLASLAIGFALGLAATGTGWLGRTLTRLIDILLALPSMVMALAVVGALGIGMVNLVIAFTTVGWPYYARLVRGFALTRLQDLDIRAARATGLGRLRLLADHVLPHAARSLGIAAGLDLGYTLSALEGFSYLGLGAQAPAAEWGLMLRDAQLYGTAAPWLLLGPSLGIALAVLAATLLLEDAHAAGLAR